MLRRREKAGGMRERNSCRIPRQRATPVWVKRSTMSVRSEGGIMFGLGGIVDLMESAAILADEGEVGEEGEEMWPLYEAVGVVVSRVSSASTKSMSESESACSALASLPLTAVDVTDSFDGVAGSDLSTLRFLFSGAPVLRLSIDCFGEVRLLLDPRCFKYRCSASAIVCNAA